jgi:hypothetical protein
MAEEQLTKPQCPYSARSKLSATFRQGIGESKPFQKKMKGNARYYLAESEETPGSFRLIHGGSEASGNAG